MLFNGANDQSYAAFDLDGFTLNANGFFILGNTGFRVVISFAGNLAKSYYFSLM
ncbi:MAG: hypothetical protein IPN86_13745 [Saprospiraceae bacterium]|nr:hypothetical protein [Saprospiraceae bacterium]